MSSYAKRRRAYGPYKFRSSAGTSKRPNRSIRHAPDVPLSAVHALKRYKDIRYKDTTTIKELEVAETIWTA